MRRENEKKENGKKENRKKENEEKSVFYFYVFGWRENEKKMKRKKIRVILKWHIYPYYNKKQTFYFNLIFKCFL